MTEPRWQESADRSVAMEPAAARAAMRNENFPVALAVLPRHIRRHLTAAYNYARYVDDLGDKAPGARIPRLEQVAAEVRLLYAGGIPGDPVVAALRPLVADTTVPMEPMLRLIEANIVDQRVVRYETFDELEGYCRLSANPVGEIVLHIFDRASVECIAFSNRICTALQLLEHWQDIGEDYASGRVYVPQRDLRRFKVAEPLLGSGEATDDVRALIAFETDRALAWLDAGAPLVSTLHGWSRLAVSGYIAGGRAAAHALRLSGHDPMKARKPSTRQIAVAWAVATVRWPG
ncbi:squalene synthase HpnC [Arthrobacter terrae]|nr:squalene synthase HpnC [Arthrobacter terrae]